MQRLLGLEAGGPEACVSCTPCMQARLEDAQQVAILKPKFIIVDSTQFGCIRIEREFLVLRRPCPSPRAFCLR